MNNHKSLLVALSFALLGLVGCADDPHAGSEENRAGTSGIGDAVGGSSEIAGEAGDAGVGGNADLGSGGNAGNNEAGSATAEGGSAGQDVGVGGSGVGGQGVGGVVELGGTGNGGSDPGVGGTGGVGGSALALYPAFDTSLLMWSGQQFNEPTLPQDADGTHVTANDETTFADAFATGHVTITVPSGTSIPYAYTSGSDVEVIISAGASLQHIRLEQAHRVRYRGPGTIGAIDIASAESDAVSDIVFDGVVINPHGTDGDGQPFTVPEARDGTIIAGGNRIAFLHSVIRGPTEQEAAVHDKRLVFYFTYGPQDLLFADCNIATDADPSNPQDAWVFRFTSGEPGRGLRRVLIVDSTMEMRATAGQAVLRFSGEAEATMPSALIEDVMLYRSTLVSIFDPGGIIHSQDAGGAQTDDIFMRECTTVMSDLGGSSLWTFGARLDSSVNGLGRDRRWHFVDHTYRARSPAVVDAAAIAAFMDEAPSVDDGADWQYLGEFADPTARDRAVFEYDEDIASAWPADAVGSWPSVFSPLVGAVIGSNPHLLP